MELLSENYRTFLEKENLQDVVLKFVVNGDKSCDSGVSPEIVIMTFVEMCVEIFGGGGNGTGSAAAAAKSSIENCSQKTRATSSINSVENDSLTASSPSPTLIAKKCVNKYRQVLRRYYDMRSVSLEKYLKQSDLNAAREAALWEATQFFLQIRNKPVDNEEDPLLQLIKLQIAQEYSWVQAVNQQKKSRFLQRICCELDKTFVEKVELRYGTLFTDTEFPDAKLRFCDERRLDQVVEEFVNDTLDGFKEYLNFSCEESAVSPPSITYTEIKTQEMQARERLVELKNMLLQRNRQIVQKAMTFLHSHLEDSATDCRVGIEKKLEADPFLTKQQIYESLIVPKKRKYIEEFSTRVHFTDDNAEFQRDFKKQLTAKIDNALESLLESAQVSKQHLMAQFSDRLQHDLHQLVNKLSKEHGIRQRHANKLNVSLIETAKRSLEGIQHEVNVKTSKWTCVPITNVSFPSSFPAPVGASAFSIQLSYSGLRVGILRNNIPHVLRYTTVDKMNTSIIPLVVGIAYGNPGEFVFGHEVEERRKLGCLRSSWNLAKMLHEKHHHRTSTKYDTIRLNNTEFTPTLEFLLACVLKRCKKLCVETVRCGGDEKNSKELVSGLEKCVISVPPRLLPFQRVQVKDAGRIAGFLDGNLRIVEDASCLLIQAQEQNKNDETGKTARPPHASPNNDNGRSEYFLVVSQYMDFQNRVKIDFTQYRRVVNTTKIYMEHYIDEEIIKQNHLVQCQYCKPTSPGKNRPSSSLQCEVGRSLQESASSLKCFFMSILNEALAHPKSFKVTHIILNCELSECQTILNSELPQYLPNLTISMEGVKHCGEYGVLLGLIQMSRGALWDKWVSNNLHTRPCSGWVKNRNGSLTRKLTGYRMNEPHTTRTTMEGQLSCTDYQVCVNFGLTERDGVDWGCLTIYKEISQNQTFRPKFTLTDTGIFRLAKVDLYEMKQNQQLVLISTLEADKDYNWVTGNITKAKFAESITHIKELIRIRSNGGTRSAISSRRKSVSDTSSTTLPPLSAEGLTEFCIYASAAPTNTPTSSRNRRWEPDDKRHGSLLTGEVIEKKVRMDM